MRFLAILLTCICSSAFGASYYVRTNGNNSNPGSTGSPWRTIQKGLDSTAPGDNVIVGDGDFNEHLTTKTNGVTLISENLYGAQFRALRINNHTNVWVEGFRIDGFSDANNIESVSWQGNIRLEIGSDSTTIVSNKFRGVYVKGMGFSHTVTSNELRSAEVDFIAAGFTNGSHIYLGSCGLPGFYGTNHNTEWIVSRISTDGHSVFLTNGGGSNFLAEASTNLWIQAYAGNGSEGLYNIFAVRTGGNQPSNVVIRGNTFEDTFGPGIMAQFDSGLIESNYFGTNAGFRFIALQGSNLRVRGNIFANSHNLFRYTQDEVQNMAHPPGTAFFDHLSASISAFSAGSSNNIIEYNVWYDVENQFGLSDNYSDSSGLYYRSNLIIGVSEHYSGGRPDFRWEGNTFVDCAYLFGSSIPLALGGSPPQITGLTIERNLFINNGDHSGGDGTGSTEGFYTVSTNAASPTLRSNWVAASEVLGYAGKSTFVETNGVNGGNPVFRDIMNPVGPDGIWFTEDDGLRPLPGSGVAERGWGALAPPPSNAPYAHFKVTSPIGWFEPNSSATYNTNWLAIHPALRPGMQRDFRTPETLGAPPLQVTFTASNTFSPSSTTISSYTWDFGDGSRPVSVIDRPWEHTARHWYVSTGQFLVKLTITNSAGQVSVSSNIYSVSGAATSPIKFASTSGDNTTGAGTQASPWRTLLKAYTNSAAGDFIVGIGNLDENLDLTRDSNSTNNTKFIGLGARSSRFNVRKPDYHFEGWQLTTNSGSTALLYLYPEAHRTKVYNNVLGPATNNTYGMNFVYGSSSAPGHSASDCIVSNNILYRIDYIQINLNGGTNHIRDNWSESGEAQADFLRPAGKGHVVIGNTMTNVSNIDEAHTDLIQWFGFRSEYRMSFGTNELISMTLPVDGDTFTINGSTRTWRTSVTTPSTEVLIAPIVTTLGAALKETGTNLWNHATANPFTNTFLEWEGGTWSTTVRSTISGTALTRSRTGTWGYIAVVEQPEVYLQDIYIGRNRMLRSRSQVCQIETYEQNTNMVGPVWFVANWFNGNGAANVSGNGFKWINNTWYFAPTNTGIALTGGGTKGSAYGTEMYNNAFVGVGSNPAATGAGWYGTSPLISNGSLDADFNYVAGWNGTNWLTKAEAPPDSSQKFRSYGLDEHGVNGGNPGYVNSAGYDFRITTNSVQYLAGTNLYAMVPASLRFDLLNNALPSSGAWSIGPYQSTSTETGGGGGSANDPTGRSWISRQLIIQNLIVNQ